MEQEIKVKPSLERLIFFATIGSGFMRGFCHAQNIPVEGVARGASYVAPTLFLATESADSWPDKKEDMTTKTMGQGCLAGVFKAGAVFVASYGLGYVFGKYAP
jgi:hypothetical protein